MPGSLPCHTQAGDRQLVLSPSGRGLCRKLGSQAFVLGITAREDLAQGQVSVSPLAGLGTLLGWNMYN